MRIEYDARSVPETRDPQSSHVDHHPQNVKHFLRDQPQVVDFVSQKDPASLQRIALEAFLGQLKSLCRQQSYTRNKRALKHHLKLFLPYTLRQQLIDLALKEARVYTLVDLHLFELLLSPSVISVTVHSIRPFFRQQFVALLHQLGFGLQHLTIDDTCWLDDRETLPSALARMSNLTTVSLRFLADDNMMTALARSCLRLKAIDVSNSTGVTDLGMRALCNPSSVAIEGRNFSRKQAPDRTRKTSAPAALDNSAVSGFMLWLPRLVRGVRRHSAVVRGEGVWSHFKRHSQSQPASFEEVGRTTEQSCITSLHQLDVRGTRVTASGLNFISSANPSIIINF